jgi:hypothetical protein
MQGYETWAKPVIFPAVFNGRTSPGVLVARGKRLGFDANAASDFNKE